VNPDLTLAATCILVLLAIWWANRTPPEAH